MNSMRAGAWLVLRALRGRSAWLIAAAAVAFATIASVAERKVALGDAASRALQGPAFGLAIPIAVFALTSTALQRGRLDEAMGSLVLIGAGRRAAAIGAAAALSVAAALLGLVTASASALAAHGLFTGASIADAATAGWIGALVSIAYALLFAAASNFGARGGGRFAVLAIDLVIGPMSTRVASVLPRAHALNLLGAPDVAPGFSQRASFAALFMLMALFVLVLARRVRP